ncbi:hypothetical protein [Dyella terrae]|uniref:hypothetical protein n=1 Tax=Dyella terrae TaxID=522259 RepID=UPI001EFCF44D|nr:hypothetical protein [Dyella terrae]ULU25962.1 hypothetical protein DYST_02900 [Dyella terrae]
MFSLRVWVCALIWPVVAFADGGERSSEYGFRPGPLPAVARDVSVTYRATMSTTPKETYWIRLRIKQGGMPYIIDFPNAARDHHRPWMPLGGFDDSYWVVDARPGKVGHLINPANRNFNRIYGDTEPLIDITLVSYARSTTVAGQPCELWNAIRMYPHFRQQLEVCLSRDAVVLRVTPRFPGITDTLEAEAVTYQDLPATLFEIPPGYFHMVTPPPPPPNATLSPYDAPASNGHK